MQIKIFSKDKTNSACFNVEFSYGDIVKIEREGAKLPNKAVFKVFGINDPNITQNEWLDYPNLKRNFNQWKIVDFGSNYYWELLFLVKDRIGNYAVIGYNKRDSCPLSLIRKNMNLVKSVELISKF